MVPDADDGGPSMGGGGGDSYDGLRQLVTDIEFDEQKLWSGDFRRAVFRCRGLVNDVLSMGTSLEFDVGQARLEAVARDANFDMVVADFATVEIGRSVGVDFRKQAANHMRQLKQIVDKALAIEQPGGIEHQRLPSSLYDDVKTLTVELQPLVLNELNSLVRKYESLEDQEVSRKLLPEILRLRTAVGSAWMESDLRQSVATARAAAAAASESAGTAGTSTLAAHFSKFSASEQREARFWLVATILILAAGVWLAYEHLGTDSELEWIDIVRRILIATPGAAIAAICGQQAHTHGTTGIWLKHMAVQLQTVRGFSDELPEEQKFALRTEFGAVIFSGPPELGRRGRKGMSINDSAVQLLQEILTQRSAN